MFPKLRELALQVVPRGFGLLRKAWDARPRPAFLGGNVVEHLFAIGCHLEVLFFGVERLDQILLQLRLGTLLVTVGVALRSLPRAWRTFRRMFLAMIR